ncbi:MAG: hypothetical protein PCFJNLEI_01556 [Verrucomicrobiae bacterium]|nr:hypothetical protein [Verrucomicrobiae bacterium]
MKPSAIFAGLVVLLTACATTNEVMQTWVGQPESKLIARYGAPDTQISLPDGSSVYTWKRTWHDRNGFIQIGRQNFIVNSSGIITDFSANNVPRYLPVNTANEYSAMPLTSENRPRRDRLPVNNP